ncbi:hypothetical protein MGN70_004481 [Eutypa lata]|nr:hypothetical protein MGN70_004481 [Eutypa lata]
MATAKTFEITPENTGLWHVKQSELAAKKTSELLQKDLEKHHVYFNHAGFHNHVSNDTPFSISHQLLALYGSGAPPESLEKAYKGNEGYQRPTEPVHGNPAKEFQDWAAAKPHLGKEEHYADFLVFFQGEIDRLGGWENTLLEYMFKGDERSEDILVRMWAGLFHPIIQLMYGIEWRQPAIVAMALAQAAVHSNKWLNEILPSAEAAAAATTSSSMPSIVSLLDAVRTDHAEQMMERVDINDNKTLSTQMERAWEAARKTAERVRVDPAELDERTAEMYDAALYEGASAALLRWPAKGPKWDFFLIHLINLSPIFLSINAQDWIPLEAKVRLLEWKIRFDLLWYAALGCPELSLDRIASYEPKDDKGPQADDKLRSRLFALSFEDDGHASKLFRSVYVGRHAIKKYDAEGKSWVKIRDTDDTWDKLAHMVVDSIEAPGPHWVRNAGNPDAWKEFANRSS